MVHDWLPSTTNRSEDSERALATWLRALQDVAWENLFVTKVCRHKLYCPRCHGRIERHPCGYGIRENYYELCEYAFSI